MKADIHPKKYRFVVFKDFSCNEAFLSRSAAETKDTIVWEDGNESDATDWKWAEHQSFYDENWLSIDEEEINEGL